MTVSSVSDVLALKGRDCRRVGRVNRRGAVLEVSETCTPHDQAPTAQHPLLEEGRQRLLLDTRDSPRQARAPVEGRGAKGELTCEACRALAHSLQRTEHQCNQAQWSGLRRCSTWCGGQQATQWMQTPH